jgi:ABC-2 type transport system ATP-binding protein
MENGNVIDLADVSKTYKGKVHALQGIAMRVRRGEIFGLLGPNGAGKSTLVKIMMTVVKPTRAAGTILGHTVGHKPTLAKIGYLPEHHRFPRYLTGRQTLEFFAALCDVDRATRKKRAAELLETVGMTTWADHRVSTYSKGMMQRIGVAQALVNNPELVVLDEPTDGVDPVGRMEIRSVLGRMRDQGKTVFVNSHLLSELEMICDRVAILVGGRVAMQGTINELTSKTQRYEIDVAGDAATAEKIRGALSQRAAVRWNAQDGRDGNNGLMADGTAVEISGLTIVAATTNGKKMQPLLDALRGAGMMVLRVQVIRQSLENLFIEAVGGVSGGHAAGARLGGSEARP